MIEINELRIGNLVKYGMHISPVLSIFNGTSGNVKSDNPYVCLPHPGETRNIYEIEPIPLTPEILEKCGFIKTVSMLGAEKDFEYTDYRYGMMVLNTNEKWGHTEVEYDPFNIDDRGHICKVKYLHQLQNLHFCLCGKELIYHH